MGSEKFCLRWNDFEANISSAFRELRDDKDFFDVTLACDDEQIQAHKVILSACSPFFRNILRRNPHQHPLLYLKGVKYTDLQSVLNFMYHGEVNIAQEELNSFLAVAEDLRVKGLTQNNSGLKHKEATASKALSTKDQEPPPPPKRPRPAPPSKPVPTADDDDIQEVVPIKSEPRDPHMQLSTHGHVPVTAQPQVYSNDPQSVALDTTEEQSVATYEEETVYEEYGDYQDYQQYTEEDISMPGKEKGPDRSLLLEYIKKQQDGSGIRYKCTMCTMSNKLKTNVVNHVESAHFPDTFTYSCEYCGKTFKSLNSKNVHVSKMHRNFRPDTLHS